MALSDEKKKHYYRLGYKEINEVVEKELKEEDDGELVLYGGRAINLQLPGYLRLPAKDWDIFSIGSPSGEEAREIEQALDQRYGGNYFEVSPAKHEGTFRIKSKVTGKVVVDVTVPPGKVDFTTLKGINVATLDWHVKRFKRIHKDSSNDYRWEKDKETLQRIRLSGRRGKK